MTRVLSIIPLASFLFLPLGTAEAGWEVTDPNLGTIAMGVDFLDENTGYIAGGQDGTGPVIWKTATGGDNYTVATDELLSMMYLDVAMSDGDFGIAGGLGMFYAWSGAVRTTDAGRSWDKTGGLWFFATYQDVEVVNDRVGVMAGAWGNIRGYSDGIAYTSDAGRNWEFYDWGVDTSARYVDFVTPEVGYIAGGHWPTESAVLGEDPSYDSRLLNNNSGFQMSQSLRLPIGGGLDPRTENLDSVDYRGVVAKSTSSGQNWDIVLDIDGLYFNGVHFVDEDNGWVVGEGDDFASIFHTSDGGATWEEQWNGNATLLNVRMVDAMTGWAVGGDLSDRRPTGLILQTTNGGDSWEPSPIDGDFIFMSIDVVDVNMAVAVGYNLSNGQCGVVRYTGE